MVDLIYYAKLENSKIIGYYMEEIHGVDFCKSIDNHIKVDRELHDYLLAFGEAQFDGINENKIYRLQDKGLFSKVITTSVIQGPSTEERIAALEQLVMGVL